MCRRQNGICSERTLKRIEHATFSVLDYDVSVEDSLVVMSTTDREGKQRLWVARGSAGNTDMVELHLSLRTIA